MRGGLVFECPKCGIMSEVGYGDDPEEVVVRCSRCKTEWLAEVASDGYWLEPVQELR